MATTKKIAVIGLGNIGKIVAQNLVKGNRAASLASAAFQLPEQAVLFYASDDRSVDEEVDQLILDSGFNPLRIGGLDQSIRIEVFGDLHEFGALGKTVSLSEAKSRV
ncbi:hypothetical protein [Sphingobacterium siyangense]